MRKDMGKRLTALFMAVLILSTSPLDAMNTYGVAAAGENYTTETAGEGSTDSQTQAVIVDADDTEGTSGGTVGENPEKPSENPDENGGDTETSENPDENGGDTEAPENPDENGGDTEAPENPDENGGDTEAPENPDENGGSEETPENPDENGGTEETPEVPETPEETTEVTDNPEDIEKAVWKAEDVSYQVGTRDDFDLLEGIEYDKEHYDLSVKDEGYFASIIVGDYVVTYLLKAKAEGYKDIEFTRTISVYQDPNFVIDGEVNFKDLGDDDLSIDDNGIATYSANSINVNAPGSPLDYLKVSGDGWATLTKVMYAPVNGVNRLVYCLSSTKKTPYGSNSLSTDFKQGLQEKMNYVLYHGARYYGSCCYNSAYSVGNTNKDYYITSMAVHMLNAWAGYENGYIFPENTINGMSAEGREIYYKATALANDANKYYKSYTSEKIFNRDFPTLSVSGSDGWKGFTENGKQYYRTKQTWSLKFTDVEGFAGRGTVTCKNKRTGETMGKVVFDNANSQSSSFHIVLNEKNYAYIQSMGDTIQVKIKYKGYQLKATRYDSGGNRQPIALIQFDGNPIEKKLSVSAKTSVQNIKLYVVKKEKGTDLLLQNGQCKFEVWEWNKNSQTYKKKVDNLRWNGYEACYISNSLPVTVLNQGKYKVIETQSDSKHKGNWVGKVKAKSSDSDIILTATNDPLPSKVKIKKVDAATGKAVSGAQFAVYSDPKCTKLVITSSVSSSSGEAITGEFTRTQEIYWVKEIKAPYGYNRSNEVKEVTVEPNETAEVTFENDPVYFSLKVKKSSNQNKNLGLPGAVYGVYSKSDCSSTSLLTKIGPTDTKGEGVSGMIRYYYGLNKVYVKELVAPKYYKLSNEIKEVPVDAGNLTEGKVLDVGTFYNDEDTTTVVVHKKDDEGKPLKGAVFQLYEDAQCQKPVAKVGPTDEKGEATIQKFHPTQNTYYLKEITVPTGYPAQPNKIYTATLKNGRLDAGLDFNISNSNKIRVGVYKYELGSGKSEPLAGAKYTLYASPECNVLDTVATLGPTSDNGYALSDEFIYNAAYDGIYYMKETKAPFGYKTSDEVKKIDVSNAVKDGTIPYVTFYNKKYEVNVEVVKVDSKTNKPLKGAEFALYSTKPAIYAPIKTGKTDKDGKVTFTFEPTQETYYIYETKAPNGYHLNRDWKEGIAVHVSDSEEGTKTLRYTAKNDERTDTFPLTVTKKATSYGTVIGVLAGFRFNICAEDKTTGEVTILGEITTLSDGKGTCENVKLVDNANYYLIETGVGDPQYTDSIGTIYPFEPDGTNPVEYEVKNELNPGKVRFRKLEKGTHQPLQGAKFRIYRDPECTDLVAETEATSTDGYTPYIALPNTTGSYPTYYVKEIQYPKGEGWKELEKPVEFSAPNTGSSQDVYIENEKEEPSIVIYKYDSRTGKPLAGVMFEIKGPNIYAGRYVTTDENGYIRISSTENTYLYQEIYQQIGQTYTVKETQAPEGYKVSTDTQTLTLSYGENRVEFANDPHWYGIALLKQSSSDGKAIEGAVYGLYTSADCSPESKLTQLTTKNTFVYTDKIYVPDLKAGQSIWLREEYVPDEYVLDTEPKEVKLDTEDAYTRCTVTDDPVEHLPIEIYKYGLKSDGTKEPLEGVQFYLNRTATDKITSESIYLGNTSATGYIKEQLSEDVTPGDYYLVEKVPHGYKNPENPRKITLVQGNSNHFDVANVTDDSVWYGLSVYKIDEDTKDPLQGVVFDVYADEACTVWLEALTATNVNGKTFSKIYSDQTLANVWVKERPDTVPYGYKVKNTPVNVQATTPNAYTEVIVKNEKIKKDICVDKKDSYTSEPVAGAKFALYEDADCTKLIAGPSITGANGNVRFVNIPVSYQTVYMKELEAPEGYKVDPNAREITLTADAVTQTVEWKNEREWTRIPVLKRDEYRTELGGVQFEVYKDADCTDRVTEAGTITTYTNGKGCSDIFPRTQEWYYLKEVSVGKHTELVANIGRVFPVQTKALENPNNPGEIPENEYKVIYNSTTPVEISVKKQDANTKAPVAGAVFNIYAMDDETTPLGVLGPTDADGIATAKISLPSRVTNYFLKEVYVPAPYKLLEDWIPVNTSTSTVEQPAVVENEQQPSRISLTKVDADTGEGLEGAEFAAYLTEDDAQKGVNQQFKIGPTDVNGFALSEEFFVKSSTYCIKEIKPPKGGYVLSNVVRRVEVPVGEVADAGIFENEKREVSIPVKKIDGNTGAVLSGAEFGVYLTAEDARDRKDPIKLIGPTDNEGKAESEKFVPEQDSYYLIETKAPEGYVRSDVVQEVIIDDNVDPSEYTFKNYKNATYIEVTKVDSQDTNKKLAGAVFEIYTDQECTGSPIQVMDPTDEHGYSKSGSLPDDIDVFYLKEITAPTGYKIAPVQEVAVLAGDTKPATVQDDPNPKQIEVIKQDQLTKRPLKGAVFTAYEDKECTKLLIELPPTNESGYAISDEFYYDGKICYLKETKGPDEGGYFLSDEVYEVELKQGEDEVSGLDVPIYNEKLTVDVKIKKTTSSGEALAGAVFGVYTDPECEDLWLELPATDENGESVSNTFTPDQENYYVKELYAPLGYKLSDEVDKITITEDQKEYVVTRSNEPVWTKIRVHKYDAETKEDLSGAKFAVYSTVDCEPGTELKEIITGSDGTGVSDKILMTQDVFYVKEIQAPTGYIKTQTVWKVTAVENDVCAMLEVPNAKEGDEDQLVQVKVVKYESGTGTTKPLGGAYFTVYKDEECTQPVVEVGPTEELSGTAISTKFVKEQDEYWIKESKAPVGYELNQDVNPIIPGTDVNDLEEVAFYDDQKMIKIRVNKSDADDSEPVEGAYFKVYKTQADAEKQENEVCKIGPTNAAGVAEKSIQKEQDVYYLRESQKVMGYVRSDQVDELIITGDVTDYYAENTPEYTKIQIKKIDAGTKEGLANAEFNIYTDSSCSDESFVDVLGPTDENGYATTGSIKQGKGVFYLKETKAPDGYLLSDMTVEGPIHTSVGEVATWTVENEKIPISFTIQKKDASTRELMDGAKFALYKDEDCTEYVLDFTKKGKGIYSSGSFYATQSTYYVKETVVPEGYEEPEYPTKVNVLELDSENENDPVVTIWNTLTGVDTIRVSVNKVDAVTGDAVPGAVFGVYSKETCADDELLTTLPETDASGYAQSEKFVYIKGQDTYYLKEIGTPKWYVADADVIPFKVEHRAVLDENGDPTSEVMLYVSPQTIKNQPEQTQIQVKKVEKINGNLSEPLAGAYFKVYKRKEDAQKQQNAVCDIGPTGADGIAKSEEFHRTQETPYYVRESQAPAGYILSSDIYEVETTVGGVSETDEIVNDPKITDVQILKTTKDGKTPLAGALFALYESPDSRTPVTVFPLTGENGIAHSDPVNITQEWYYLKELRAPKGYERIETAIPVRLENGETTYVGPLKNGSDMDEIHILKLEDKDFTPLAGAIYGIYENEDCEEGTEIGSIGPTADDGRATSRKFVRTQDVYYLRELQAPEGYERSDQPIVVNLAGGDGTEENPVKVLDTKKMSQIKIYKYDTVLKEQIKGIQFTAYLDKECKNKTDFKFALTDDDGYAVSDLFTPTQDIYYVKETGVPDDYPFQIPDTVWEVSVISGETAKLEVANGALAKIYIKKIAEKASKDGTDTPLSGAEFDIYKDAACTIKVGSVGPTDENGTASSTSFTKEKSTYYLKETKAPEGYKLNPDPIEATVTDLPQATTGDATEGTPAAITPVWNTVTNAKLEGSITIKKRNADETPLFGAEFQLEVYDEASSTWVSSGITNQTTGADGNAVFEHLVPGKYRLTEVKAPAGYNLLNSSREITIPYELNVADVKEPSTGYTEVVGEKIYYYDVTLTFYNSLPFDIPSTGGGGMGGVTAGMALMLGTSASAWLLKRKKRKLRAG